MKKLAIVLTIIYFIAISASVVYSLISDDLIADVKAGSMEKLERQLQTNKDRNEVYNALYYAMDNENVDAVKIFLNYFDNSDFINWLNNKGLNTNGADSLDGILLQWAIYDEKYSTASMLIDRGADVSNVEYKFDLTKKELEETDVEALERIIKIAADNTDSKNSTNISTFFRTAVYLKNNKLLDFLIGKYDDDSYLNEALATAVYNSDIQMIDYITGKGGSLKVGEISGIALLYRCTDDTIEHIINNYDSVDDQIAISALKRSLVVDRLELAKYILERGIDLNKLNDTAKDAPVLTAIKQCNPEALKLILDYNVPINVKDETGKDVFEVIEDVRKGVEWFDFQNKGKLDTIYNMLKDKVKQ